MATSYRDSGLLRKRGMDGLPNFNLPASESKMIVCGETVFKVKTRPLNKDGEIGTNEAHFKNENVQSDLKCIIGGILQLILDNQENPPLRPVYSDNIVVYPQISGPWTVAGQLRFFCNNVELRTYQQILQLFVELKEAKPDTAHQPATNEPTKVSHHSRKRSPPPQQSSQVDPRKRPKHDPSDHQSTKLVHNADEKVAAMPRTGRDYEYPKDKLSDVEIRRRYLEEEKRLKHLSRRAQYEHSTRKM